MTLKINSIDINGQEDLERSLEDIGEVQSIKINRADGTFFVSYPLDNSGTIIRYPQNPTNSSYSSTSIKTIEDYGDLNFCLDMGIDLYGQKLWIADAGNTNVVVLNLQDNTFIRVIEGFTLPHSILVNPLDRSVFIKSFVDDSTQRVTHVDKLGNILFEFDFPADVPSTTITETVAYLNHLPKPNTMDFDSNLNRLWFVSEAIVYMVDLDTNQIITQDLKEGRLDRLSSISVDRSSGNAFVIIDDVVNYYIQQIYKDNNLLLGTAYLEEQIAP
jgi:DNA-binding beta-propeller fold protein YncE